MAQVTTTLTGVTTKSGKNTRGAWTKSIFSAADGREYGTFDGALASQAQALIGQPVTLEYSESKRGQYTNNVIKAVAAAAEGAVQAPVATASGGAKSGEFRTKEQILYTSALELAVTSFGIAGVSPIDDALAVFELSDEFYARLGDW